MMSATTDITEIRPVDLVITEALLQRSERAPEIQAEMAAFCELSEMLAAASPRETLQRFSEVVLHLCNAGSAGISLLKHDGAGQTIIRWETISGALASYKGDERPRNFSPCGLCLDAGASILISGPERAFVYLNTMTPAISEELIIPLHDNAKRPLGTLWIAHHDPTRRFCANDARILQQFAVQVVLALKLLREEKARRTALTMLESHKTAHQTVALDLVEERHRREQAEISESGIRQALIAKDAVIMEVHHRVKNTIQMVGNLLSLQARASYSAEVRTALEDCHERLNVLAKVHELLYRSASSAQEILMPSLLQAVGDALRQAFADMSDRVELHVTSDQIVLPADDAIPMILLANEVITNAYKHAFPDGASGEITVFLRCLPNNTVLLQITDHGIGIRSNAETGLGLKLIRSFSAQLRGKLTYAKPADTMGTVVTLTIGRRPGEGTNGLNAATPLPPL